MIKKITVAFGDPLITREVEIRTKIPENVVLRDNETGYQEEDILYLGYNDALIEAAIQNLERDMWLNLISSLKYRFDLHIRRALTIYIEEVKTLFSLCGADEDNIRQNYDPAYSCHKLIRVKE